jgi:hypothetical protein
MGLANTAQAQAPPTKPGQESVQITGQNTSVSGVTVTASRTRCGKVRTAQHDADIPAPKVVSTYPAQGAVVRPGLLVFRVTFDLPMTCDALVLDHEPQKNPCPGSTLQARQSFDHKIFWTVCKVAAGQSYGVWLNPEGKRDHAFTSLAGKLAAPFALTFTTSKEVPVKTVLEAMNQDAETVAYMTDHAGPSAKQ